MKGHGLAVTPGGNPHLQDLRLASHPVFHAIPKSMRPSLPEGEAMFAIDAGLFRSGFRSFSSLFGWVF